MDTSPAVAGFIQLDIEKDSMVLPLLIAWFQSVEWQQLVDAVKHRETVVVNKVGSSETRHNAGPTRRRSNIFTSLELRNLLFLRQHQSQHSKITEKGHYQTWKGVGDVYRYLLASGRPVTHSG